MKNTIKLKDLISEFGTRKKVKTITIPESRDYYADIMEGLGEFEIELGSYKGLTHYMLNTKKTAKSLKEAEKIAKKWLKSYVKNPK